MRRFVPLLAGALCFAPRVASAGESDPWWGEDKALHFGVSVGLSAGGYAVSSLWLDERWQRATAGATFSLTLGIGKELWDLSGHGSASYKDFTWDVAGTLVGTGLALAIDLAVSGKRSDGEHTTALIRF
jgi:putative lipoprotein